MSDFDYEPLDHESRLRDLEVRCVKYEGVIETVRYLATMMSSHVTPTIRVYGESLLQAIDDPDAWQAAIAATKTLPIGLALDLATPSSVAADGVPRISTVLSRFTSTWSDALGADSVRVIGPVAADLERADVSDALEAVRAWRCADWTIRQYTAFWLDQVDRRPDAMRLRAMSPVLSIDDLENRALPVLSAIADQVEAERNDQGDAAQRDPSLYSSLLDASFVATSVGGAEAAFDASAVEVEVSLRIVDAAQSLWVSSVVCEGGFNVHIRLEDFRIATSSLQEDAARLLRDLIALTDEDTRF